MIDFVIINYNTPELTCKCISTIFDTYSQDARIIIVDNASVDNSIIFINGKYPQVKIIANVQNYGYSKAVNIGVAAANSELVIVSNSDVEYHKNSINILEELMIEDTSIGVAGFFQFYPDGSPQRSYGYLPGFKLAIYEMFLINSIIERIHFWKRKYNILIPKTLDADYIDGASLMIRKSLFDKLNGFDEDYFFYTEEADYCYRVNKAGFRNVIKPKATITHIRGASSSSNNTYNIKSALTNQKSNMLYLKKNCSKFEASFFKFARITHFTILNKIALILTVILSGSKQNHFKIMSNIYQEISNLWRNTQIEK
jgi:GT2 family glycosyltransferase